MKYYLIAGEASGDLHASHLMRALQEEDKEAEFRFFGGDLMAAVGGTRVKHYRELAYMGFIPVLLHLPTILRNMKMCKRDIAEWQPDAVILVDYPGFNLDIAKFVHRWKTHSTFNTPHSTKVYYYIAPKIWAWKEYRIKRIKRDIDKLFSILPFEKEFFEGKHHYPIEYVGNPTAQEVREYLMKSPSTFNTPHSTNTIALLAGSRKQEIKDNLPAMLQATRELATDYQLVIAGAPGIEHDYYNQFIKGYQVQVVYDQTYSLLSQAHAALVTSGTATLETCCFGVPQPFIGLMRRLVLKVKYVSLVNLIANREVVPELVAERFSVEAIRSHLSDILDGPTRQRQLDGYAEVARALGNEKAPQRAAQLIVAGLKEISL